MGKPGGSHVPSSSAEFIGGAKRTGGSETSQYPQEEKEISIPSVAASERGIAQTRARLRAEVLRELEGRKAGESKTNTLAEPSGKSDHRG